MLLPRVAIFAGLFLCQVMIGCAAVKTHEPEGEKRMADGKIQVTLEKRKDELLAIPGVTGVAEGRCRGKPCVKVYVTKKTTEISGKIPSQLEGFPVSVEETGELKPLPEKVRP